MIEALRTLVRTCKVWNEGQKAQVLAWLECAKDFGNDNDRLDQQNAELKTQIEKMKSDYDKLLDEKIELEDRLAESRGCFQISEHRQYRIFGSDYANIAEKRIAELEKELKLWNDTTDARLTLYFQQKQKIADLEKENAELKSIADFQTSSNMDRYFQLKRSKEQLNKAKVLLKEALDKIDCVEHSRWWNKAEKFLAEE